MLYVNFISIKLGKKERNGFSVKKINSLLCEVVGFPPFLFFKRERLPIRDVIGEISEFFILNILYFYMIIMVITLFNSCKSHRIISAI